MPRPERALDVTAGPLPRFAADLRRSAGGMPYRQMARTANYSATVLSDAAAGRRLPTLSATLAYVAACDGDEEEWRARWHALATEVAPDADPGPASGPETANREPAAETPTSAKPDRRPRVITWLAAAVVALVAAVVFLAIQVERDPPTVPVAPGGAMPEHMVPLNPEITEATPTQAELPPDLPCSSLSQAKACVDLANSLVWVKDLPPGDGHHAAAYWSTTDGTAHGECHNYLSAEEAWATCPLTDLPRDEKLGLRTASVEKFLVLTWGPYLVVPTDGSG